MPSYHTLSQGDDSNEQEIYDGEATIRGFKTSSVRVAIFHLLNILTIGLPFLIARWYPHWKVKFQCFPSPLRFATYIILTDDTGANFVCEVETDSAPCLPEEFISKGRRLVHQDSKSYLCSALSSGPVFRHFTFRHEKFIWDDRNELFRKIRGLDDVSCKKILHDFQGNSCSKRLQLRQIYGVNSIEIEVQSYWKLLVDEVLNPFYVFQILSVILWCFDEYIYYATCVIIISAISISIALVETKRQSRMLREMAQSSENTRVTVRRGTNNEEEEISSRDLVPGDVVLIPPEGFIMPCDGVLIHGTCIVNESMLTGESIPVQKSALTSSSESYTVESHRRNTLFCGTQVIQTRFYAGNKVCCVVVRTGFNTIKGGLIHSILYPKEIGFKFYADAMKFIGILFALATLGMIYCVYLYVGRQSAWYVTLIRVLDIVTIVVPPALPAAMTVGTVYAQSRLKNKQIFCISPPRINFCGKLKCMCFDKTGTLTEEGLDLWCVIPLKTNSEGEEDFDDPCTDPSKLVQTSHLLRGMACGHSLTYVHGNIVGDPLDLKMFESTGWILEEPDGQADTSKFDMLVPNVVKNGDVEIAIIREFEFTPQLQRMSVVVRCISVKDQQSDMFVYAKGAPEKIRPLCNAKSVPSNFDRVLDSFTLKGYRVLAIAWKPITLKWHQVQRLPRDKVEVDLEFAGFLVMQNSLKEATIPVISELINAEIRCVMVTGDNMLTAMSVARECGIIPSCDKAIIVNVNEDNELEFKLAEHHYEGIERPDNSTMSMNNNLRNREKRSSFVVELDDCETTELLPQTNSGGRRESESVDIEDPAINMERLVPISGRPVDQTTIHLDITEESNYHFVISGKIWSILEEVATPTQMERIVAKGTVYARMSPENKSQLVEYLQKLGYVVGMCGDGANDCSALKMAHVGVSLSEAEASVAAPFTSKVPDISCIPNLIREGRCALVTSFGIFKYMALYSLVQFCSVLLLYTHATNFADTQFLYFDLGITTTIAIVMGRTEPHPRLVSQRPMGSLVSFQNVFSIVIQVLISCTIQISAMSYLQSQIWYEPVSPASPDDLLTLCWETTTIFSVSAFQYLILAFVFSKGPPFRKPFYTNGLFVFCYVVLLVFTILLVIYPMGFLASFFMLEPIENENTNFRLTLLVLPIINMVLSLVFENDVIAGVVKRGGRVFFKKKEISTYKRILGDIKRDPSWPPVQST